MGCSSAGAPRDAFGSAPVLTKALNDLFGVPVAVAVARPSASAVALDVEMAAIRHAVAHRRQEFATVRACARHALGAIGLIDWARTPIPAGPDRAPIWPEDYVGSLSHCANLCCAVVAKRSDGLSLGVDVEPDADLDESLIRVVCTAEEIDRFQSEAAMPLPRYGLLAFGAKEAFYKAYYPLTKQFLEFGDVSIRLVEGDEHGGRFTVRLRDSLPLCGEDHRFRGRWRRLADHMFAGVTRR